MMEQKMTGTARLTSELYFWLQALVTALVTLLLAFMFVGRVIAVDGGSMLPTLVDKERLLLQSIGYKPKQGDIVVLTKESFLPKPIVKRVIALGGQTVEINYASGQVRVDGTVLEEPYLGEAMLPYGGNQTAVYTIPPGSVFVMGDNRNHSSDSRDIRLGTVDERYIIGRALFVIYPIPRIGPIN